MSQTCQGVSPQYSLLELAAPLQEHKNKNAPESTTNFSKMVAINKYTAPTEETSTNTGTIMVRTGTPLNLNPAREEEIDLRQVDEQHVKSLQKEGE